jgi:hypothetical protein
MLKTWTATVFGAILGTGLAFLLAPILLFPLGQFLFDSADDDIVLWAINYLNWAVVAIWLVGCLAGAFAGRAVVRRFE